MASKKLLVADDSLTIQKVIRLALANEGYEIQAISDGNDAVQHISLFQPDLVLIDVSLPGKSAFEVKRAINQEPDLDQTRFILMSSAFERVDEVQATEVSFHGRLTKPFDPGHLREVLQKVMTQFPPRARSAAPSRPASAPSAPQMSPPPIPQSEPTGISISMDDPMDSLPLTPPSAIELSGDYSLDSQDTDRGPMPPTPPSLPPRPSYRPDAPSPAHSAPAANAGERDSDIRELTEATVRMSGLNEFEWSVQEPSRKPSPPPVPAEPTLKPPHELLQKGEIDEMSIRYFTDPKPVQETSFTDEYTLPPVPPSANHASTPPSYLHSEPQSQAAQSVPVDSQMIESIVAQRVEEVLTRVIQKQLPEIAERILKEQIRQMLSEQP